MASPFQRLLINPMKGMTMETTSIAINERVIII
jgi:hypothetical protein